MKIKEVEERVGLTRSHIRFYEREGLLLVNRDQENNYREYTEADVEKINKIKTLRMLGAPTADIRRLFANEVSFDQVISDCMKRIKEQEQELKEIHKVCENMMQKQLDIHTWDGQIEVDSKNIWQARLNEIFAQDMIHEPIERNKMNRNIVMVLLTGYGVNVIFTMILWPLFEKYQGYIGNGIPGQFNNTNILDTGSIFYDKSIHWNYTYLAFIACLVLVLMCRGIIFVCENTKIQFALFILNSLLLSPELLITIQWYEDLIILYNGMKDVYLQIFSLVDVLLFWGLLLAYIVIIYLISIKWRRVFVYKRYLLIYATIFAFMFAFIYYLKCCSFWGPLFMFLLVLEYISISWLRVNIEQDKYSRYDIFTTVNFMINPLGFFIQF